MNAKLVASCSLAILVALYVVGAISHGSLRHEVQTLPLWLPIVIGFRGNEIAKWLAFPCFVFWGFITSLIWAFLLGWSHIVTGTFSTTERMMTVVVGLACIIGIVTAFRWRTVVRIPSAIGSLGLATVLQIAAFRISLLPNIAHQ